MRINDAFPSKYLAAADLNGKTITVTIDTIQMEEVGEDHKPVVYFRGAKKGMVLNKTNASTISRMHGQDTDDWIGKRISIWPTQTDFRGDTVPCIRVVIDESGGRQAAPSDGQQKAPVAETEEAIAQQEQSQGAVPDDDIPF